MRYGERRYGSTRTEYGRGAGSRAGPASHQRRLLLYRAVLLCAAQLPMPFEAPAFGEVASALGAYFDGLHKSDPARLAEVWHPLGRLYGVSVDGSSLVRRLPAWLLLAAAGPYTVQKGDAVALWWRCRLRGARRPFLRA
jgi:hypothetical protein